MKRKSKTAGIYKRCQCLSWDKCEHSWWGRFGGNDNRVSLAKWSGQVVATKESAKKVFVRLQNAVLSGNFDSRAEHPDLQNDLTFKMLLDDYRKQYVEHYKLRANSLDAVLGVFEKRFESEKLTQLSKDPQRVEKWLQDLSGEKNWANATFNRYFEQGRAIFNWAKARKLVSENPFDIVEPKQELNKREVRITPQQEQKLLECCELLNAPPKSHRVKLEVISQTPQQDEATGEVQHPEKVLYATLVTHNDSSEVLKPRE
jgi:hypothetical protein